MPSPLQDRFHYYLLDTSGNPWYRPWGCTWWCFWNDLGDTLWEIGDSAADHDLPFFSRIFGILACMVPLDPGDLHDGHLDAQRYVP